jgi:Domain of unknown function (DUF4389)
VTYTPAMPSAPEYPAAGGLYDGREPVHVGISAAAPQQRLTVLVRLILAIPQLIVVYIISIGAGFAAFIGWSGALFTGPGEIGDCAFLAAERPGTHGLRPGLVSGQFLPYGGR